MYRGSAHIVLGCWIDADDHRYIENYAVGGKQCPPFCQCYFFGGGVPLFVIRPKKSRPLQTQFFIPLHLPNHTSTDKVTSSIAVSASLLAAWGFGAAPAHPRDPKSDSLLSDPGKTSLPLAAALRGGRAPSLASLVANRCFLPLCVMRI